MSRRSSLEPGQPIGQHPPPTELISCGLLDRAEVLSHDVCPRPRRLQRQDVKQRRVRVMDIRPVRWRLATGDPKQPEKPHDVVDTYPTGVTKRGPQHRHEWLITGSPQSPRIPRYQGPVLTERVELVRGGADAHSGREHVLVLPGVRPVGAHAHRQVEHQREPGGRRCELAVGVPLKPRVPPPTLAAFR